jgi:GTP cyclohydrolase I
MNEQDRLYNVESCVHQMMRDLNITISDDNKDTPKRIAKMLMYEVFANVGKSIRELDDKMTLFKAPNKNKVVVKGIKFTSICEHHWLPFTGYADIEYIPKAQIIGLSKIPRVVKWFSKMPQVQERLTEQIGKYLVDVINPSYLKVTLRDVRHSCVEARGIETECSTDTVFEYNN